MRSTGRRLPVGPGSAIGRGGASVAMIPLPGQQRDEFLDFPDVIGQSGFHRGRNAQRLVEVTTSAPALTAAPSAARRRFHASRRRKKWMFETDPLPKNRHKAGRKAR